MKKLSNCITSFMLGDGYIREQTEPLSIQVMGLLPDK